jgi:hypothetical protein
MKKHKTKRVIRMFSGKAKDFDKFKADLLSRYGDQTTIAEMSELLTQAKEKTCAIR